MQWDGRIDDQAISQDNKPDIASCKRFTDEVWTTFVRDMAASCDFARENVRSIWECNIPAIVLRVG